MVGNNECRVIGNSAGLLSAIYTPFNFKRRIGWSEHSRFKYSRVVSDHRRQLFPPPRPFIPHRESLDGVQLNIGLSPSSREWLNIVRKLRELSRCISHRV